MSPTSKQAAEAAGTSTKRKAGAAEGDDSDSGSDVDMINVDFVFTAPSEIDYQALKRLFVQLFYTMAPKIDAGSVADYIISTAKERALGTVIKVQDDEDNDPFAVVSAAKLGDDCPKAIAQIADLLRDSLPSDAPIRPLLQSGTLILHERMINMPAAVAAPLYRLLAEELSAADTGSHFLLFSRVFSASALDSDDEMEGDKKRRRTTARKPDGDDMGMFHPEDAIIAKHASHTATFRFPAPRDAAESFETPLFGRLVAVPKDKWAIAVQEMADAFAA